MNKGSLASVFKVHDKVTGEPFAIKVHSRAALAAKGQERRISKEFDTLKRCTKEGRGRHVVHLVSAAEEHGRVYLRLEFCPANLLQLASGTPQGVAVEKDVLQWATQTMVGLGDLHSMGVLHRRIEPTHLLINSAGVLKITGFASCARVEEKPVSLAGAPEYRAPEMERGVAQTFAVDMWSVGCTFLRLLGGVGCLPFLHKMAAHGFDDASLTNVSSSCRDLMRRLLKVEVVHRITAQGSLTHSWLKCASVAEPQNPVEALLPQSLADEHGLEEVRGPLLGSGAFGKIFVVRAKKDGQKFAVKVMKRSQFASRGMEEQLANEVEAMQLCRRCQHVVHMYHAKEIESLVYLRMELCKTHLRSFVAKMPRGCAPATTVSKWTAQLFSGLAVIHQVGFIHRDIKLDNLLLSSSDCLKIADFGWAAKLVNKPTGLAGTWQTMPPEMLEDELRPQTEAVDVWGAGCSIMHTLVGRAFVQKALDEGPTGLSSTDPWRAARERQARYLRCIAKLCPILDRQRPSHLPPPCWNFLQKVLTREIASRASVVAALGHPWVDSCPAAR